MKLLLFFLYWALISGVANIIGIYHSANYSDVGLYRYFKQMLEITVGIFLVLFISTVIVKREITIERISEFVIYSIKACVFVGVIEIMGKIVGISVFLEVFNLISHLVNRNPYIPGRIHTLSGEPSWYGIYTAFAYPFLLHMLLKHGKHKILFLLFLVTIYYTTSRTMYVVVLLQSLVFFPTIFKQVMSRRLIPVTMFLIAMSLWIGYNNQSAVSTAMESVTETISSITDFTMESDESYSSTARLGMQMTAVNMGLAHPFFGVGEGQFIFNFASYIPEWTTGSYEIEKAELGGTAQVHGMYARIFAELGVVGLLIWLSIWALSVIRLVNAKKDATNNEKKEINLLLCLIVGVFACGFNVDSFRMMVVWITFGIIAGWYLKYERRINHISE
ncbi:hypothetical protein FHS14_004643 [Paenibacillus baekrokdamisoli]|nr:O-antigen ligase family protein [Paenibacillus baekrokdamisoli]MBB3071634.1 hypothetical protein [Paenibacillus baekrokdamisoli]